MEITDYNIVIDRRNSFDKPIKNDLKTYDNIRKIATGDGGYNDDYDKVMITQLDVYRLSIFQKMLQAKIRC